MNLLEALEDNAPIIITDKPRGRPRTDRPAQAPVHEARVANEIAARWRHIDRLRPVAKVTYILGQRCLCCGETIYYVSSPLVRYSDARTGSIHEVATEVAERLPHEAHDAFVTDVPLCAACLRLSANPADHTALREGEQLELFDREEHSVWL